MAGRYERATAPAGRNVYFHTFYKMKTVKLPGFESSSGRMPHVPRVHIHLSFFTSNNFMFAVFAARPELMDLPHGPPGITQ